MIRMDYGPKDTWQMVLYQLYKDVDNTVSLTNFVARLLIPALKALQHQCEDYALLHVLRTTPVSELSTIALNVSTLPQLLQALRLSVSL
jgi:hypothetical protein